MMKSKMRNQENTGNARNWGEGKTKEMGNKLEELEGRVKDLDA
jgi:hypothetical protein